ncbi:MAG TPA: SPOR domain-containing protein [Bacteroidetes bacterium]|nr:SPOR domain-containing protein [Bacteroidota bacterium]
MFPKKTDVGKIFANNVYFCLMIKRGYIILFLGLLISNLCSAQAFIRTEDLMNNNSNNKGGELIIDQSPAIDTLISRSILANKKRGIQGFRIQIFLSSARNARTEADRVNAEFISKFPGMYSIVEYQEPGYFKVRVGNYRSRVEAYKDLRLIQREFPDAYAVPATIESPYKFE